MDAASVAGVAGTDGVILLNDLEANAHGLAALGPDDLAVLNQGGPGATGNRAVVSAGTGLGQAGLYWDGERHHPFATEGGHTDFAPRNELEEGLRRYLAREHGHVSYERVCSGHGSRQRLRVPARHERGERRRLRSTARRSRTRRSSRATRRACARST